MNEWFIVILSILAVYRISYLIAREDGPFDMFVAMRHKIGQHNWIGRGLHCILCIDFWLSLPPAIVLFGYAGIPMIIIGWLGMAGGGLIIYKIFDERG